MFENQMRRARESIASWDSLDLAQAIVNLRLPADGPAAEPGQDSIRMRALDDELGAALGLKLTDDCLIAATDDAAAILEVLEYPVFEVRFDRRILGAPDEVRSRLRRPDKRSPARTP